jgi:hypothetical protein
MFWSLHLQTFLEASLCTSRAADFLSSNSKGGRKKIKQISSRFEFPVSEFAAWIARIAAFLHAFSRTVS